MDEWASERAEGELRESEERYRSLVEMSPDTIAILQEGRLAYINPAGAALLGAESPAEVVGRSLRDFVHPDDWVLGGQRLRVVLETRQSVPPRHLRLIRLDGRTIDAESRGGPCLYKGQPAVQVVAREITEQILAAEQLRESEARYRLLAESMEDFVSLNDCQENGLYVNPALYRVTGYTPEELNSDFRARVHPDDLPAVEQCRETNLRGESTRIEYRSLCKDGTYLWLDLRATPIKDQSGRVKQILCCARDVTDRKRLEEQSRLQQEELARAARLATLGEMLASISHEINQPLYAIKNFATACLAGLQGPSVAAPDKLADWMRQIARQVERCGEIVTRLADFARKRSARRTSIDPNELVREALHLAAAEAHRCQASLHGQFAAKLPRIQGDRILLQQVLLNLLRNSCEAVIRPGRRERRVTLQTALDRSGVRFSVADTGPGFSTAEAQHMFEPFYTTKPEGLGMGLAISRSIVEAEGGALHAESNEEGGATFHMILPAEEQVAAVGGET